MAWWWTNNLRTRVEGEGRIRVAYGYYSDERQVKQHPFVSVVGGFFMKTLERMREDDLPQHRRINKACFTTFFIFRFFGFQKPKKNQEKACPVEK